MPNVPQTTEIPGQNPEPVKLLQDLENPAMDTDQKKFNYLRGLFLEEADVDEYIQYLDTDEEIDLTRKQLTKLKGALQSFKVYLKEIYLPETGERIKRFYERLEQGTKAFANPEATPQELEVIGKTRRRVAQAMQIAKEPRGVKGKSLLEAAGKAGEAPTGGKLEDKTEAEYAEFVDGLPLTMEQKEKLNLVVAGYEEAVATAKEMDKNVHVPSKEQVIAHIMALGVQRLEKIVKIMGKPGLIIEQDKALTEMIDAMNANRHYDQQAVAFFEKGYEWSGRPKKVGVSIMDMVQNPAVVPGQKPGAPHNDEQLRICEKYFRDNGMRLVSDRQYAAGMQKSLRAYEQAKKNGEPNAEKHILDFYGQPRETLTIFNQEHNSAVSKVAGGYFAPDDRRVNFVWGGPDVRDYALRGRGAVQVM
jgi:hypothetical protein